MKTDTTTKILLAAIAVGLFVNALAPLLHPPAVRAGQSFSCKGKLEVAGKIATEWPGGYKVSVDCD